MKKLFKNFRHTISLLAVITLAICAVMFGINPGLAGICVALYQLTQIAMSKRQAMCYNTTGLTPEQIKEFTQICEKLKDLGEHIPGLKEFFVKDGGYSKIKNLPELLTGEQKRVDELQGDIKKLKKQLAKRISGSGVRWVGNVPFVTNDCAEHLAASFVIDCANLGEKALTQLNPNQRSHQGLLLKAFELIGVEAKPDAESRFFGIAIGKAAMSTTQAPLPTNFVSQIVELVFAYGQARQFCTVYPLGGGTTKLPRLQAGEDDFGYLGVGTAGMSQAIAEKRVAVELVTFTPNKFGGLIRIPTELEEDTFIQLGQFLARYIARQFAKMEDKTVFLADGTGTYANQTGVANYCVANPAYLVQLDNAKTKFTDIIIDDLRNLRGKVSAAVLSNMAAQGVTSAAYYMHPTAEPFLRALNKGQLIPVYTVENGVPKIDGWPVRWIGVSAPNNGAAQANGFAVFFGDLSYVYLGERGEARVEVSKEVFFATDELAMRALERIDVEILAVDAMATLQLGAGA